MKMKLTSKQSQKQILAPTIQQSIEVLLMPVQELNSAIDQELQENPLLEVNEDLLRGEGSDSTENLQKFLEEYRHYPDTVYNGSNTGDDDQPDYQPVQDESTLEDTLLEQLRVEVNDPVNVLIGEMIIGNIDEDGYLKTSVEEIAEKLGLDDPAQVEKILKLIQQFEPAGIAARDLKECLLIQSGIKLNGDSTLISRIINDHLTELGQKKYQEIARKLEKSVEEIKKAAQTISTLEPRPARNFRPLAHNTYIIPDIFVKKSPEGQWEVTSNKQSVVPLRINHQYQKLLKRIEIKEETRNFIQEKLKNAVLFIRSIEQRYTTIQKISEYIVDRQKDFFEYGSEGLVPLTLKDVAETVGRNESTVSRAISGKYMDTPRGLLPFKFFFSQAVNDEDEHKVASQSVKEEMKSVIEDENKTDPLSDEEIRLHFQKKGTRISRRTVSKYRSALKILPSHLRKV